MVRDPVPSWTPTVQYLPPTKRHSPSRSPSCTNPVLRTPSHSVVSPLCPHYMMTYPFLWPQVYPYLYALAA